MSLFAIYLKSKWFKSYFRNERDAGGKSDYAYEYRQVHLSIYL